MICAFVGAVAVDGGVTSLIGSCQAIDVPASYAVWNCAILDFDHLNHDSNSMHSNCASNRRVGHAHDHDHARVHDPFLVLVLFHVLHFSTLCELILGDGDVVVAVVGDVAPKHSLIWPNLLLLLQLLNYSLDLKTGMPSIGPSMDSMRSIVVALEMVNDVQPSLPYSLNQQHDFEVQFYRLHYFPLHVAFVVLLLGQQPSVVNDAFRCVPYRDLVVRKHCPLVAVENLVSQHQGNEYQMVAYFVSDSMGSMMN